MTSPPPELSDHGHPAADSRRARFEGLRGEVRLRTAIDDLANQLCATVDGNFDFAVHAPVQDETLEKLSMLVNFVLDTARRGMSVLREHNATLAQLDQAKTVFLSNASHELRTPLTLILAPIEEALARPNGSLGGRDLEMAHRNAQRLLRLVNALLDFSRLEGGRMSADFASTDLAALTGELAAVFRSAIEGAGLQYQVDCPPLPAPVHVDRDMWEKIVFNLVGNAFKATLEGTVSVQLAALDDVVRLEVTDTGIGIPAEELPRLFERFHRVPGAHGRSQEGFGIGLALVQDLVRLHGGTVSVDSTPGRGSKFSVCIPRRRALTPTEAVAQAAPVMTPAPIPDEASKAAPQAAVAPARATTAQPRPAPKSGLGRGQVLVVDDNDDMREYLVSLLAEHWTVAAFGDGAAALAAAQRQPPDLVLTDIMLPGMDGHELLRALRNDVRTQHVPVILLSARAGTEAVAAGLETGADDYMVKPFTPRELVARVRTHLELSKLRLDTAIIQRVGSLLNAQLDLRTVVQTVTDEAVRLCGAQFGAFFYNVVDSNGESYMLYTLAGAAPDAFSRFPLPRNTALFAPTFAGERVVRLDDVRLSPNFGKSAPHHGMPPGHLPVVSYLAVPVTSRTGTVLGGLFFGHGEPAMFTERDERLVIAVAAQAAAALDNAHLYEREQTARAQAEAASRSKDEFLAMLGHELRNPLAPILTALELMDYSSGHSNASSTERAVIRRQVDHMVRLVDDLLDVSRIARGKITLSREPVEIAELVARALETVQPLLDERHHRIEVDVPQQGLCVSADRVRMTQVVTNLLHNAAKFTERDGHIRIAANATGAEVTLRVLDNGPGIDREDFERIFNMFTQRPQSIDRALGGLGLGLAIARNLVNMHGGVVEARSEGAGRGSEFIIRLPLLASDAGAHAAAAPAAQLGTAKDRLRILVVDDNIDAANMLAEGIRLLHGHETREAHDGGSALQMALEWPPDVVLLDLGLPVMDGFEVARQLRARAGGRPLRLIAVSGYGRSSDQEHTRAAGFDGHLVKPVDLATIGRLLEL